MAKKENEAAKTPEELIAEANEKAAAILAEAEEKAAQIEREAEEKASEIEKEITEKQERAREEHADATQKDPLADMRIANAEGEKPVTIKLFKDNDKYKDDVQVAVNGKMYVIQRGVPVTVPQKVAWALEAQARQDEKTAAMIERKEREFEENSKAHGIKL